MTEEFLSQTIAKYSEAEDFIRSDAYADGGAGGMLFLRLQRAFLGLDEITPGRLGIFAMTMFDTIEEANNCFRRGATVEGRELLVKAANAMSALAEIEAELSGI